MWRTWLGVAFLAVQLLLPLHYYACRRDRHDERFAWRMFSPMRLTQCTPQFTRNGDRVDLGRRYHEAWITVAKRGRMSVLGAMARELCQPSAADRSDGASHRVDVRLALTCQYLNATETVAQGERNLCEAPAEALPW